MRPIVRACHERWDGLGYPDGKAGVDIPIEARIVLVCDAFHAMTTDRPYRKRLPQEEAIRRLVEASGTQFDPSVVDTFVAHLRSRRRAVARLEPVSSARVQPVALMTQAKTLTIADIARLAGVSSRPCRAR